MATDLSSRREIDSFDLQRHVPGQRRHPRRQGIRPVRTRDHDSLPVRSRHLGTRSERTESDPLATFSRTLGYTKQTIIRRSPEDAFRFCSDLRNELAWNAKAKSVKNLTDNPVGIGTRYRAQWSNTGPMTVEVVRLDPPRMWETRSSAKQLRVRFRGTVDAVSSGARYTVRLELQPSGLAWLYAPLALLVMRRQERQNMARIKGALESLVPESRVLESASALGETFVASRRDCHQARG